LDNLWVFFSTFVASVELKEPIDGLNGLYIAIACNICRMFFIKCRGTQIQHDAL
jgi:hypothetical protein